MQFFWDTTLVYAEFVERRGKKQREISLTFTRWTCYSVFPRAIQLTFSCVSYQSFRTICNVIPIRACQRTGAKETLRAIVTVGWSVRTDRHCR